MRFSELKWWSKDIKFNIFAVSVMDEEMTNKIIEQTASGLNFRQTYGLWSIDNIFHPRYTSYSHNNIMNDFVLY